MICTAAVSDSSRLLRSSPTSTPASAMRRRSHSMSAPGPEVRVDGDGVQRLRDVPQIREPPLAVGAGEEAGGQAGVGGDRLQQRRHPPLVQHPGPGAHGGAQLVEQGIRRRPAQLLDRPAEEARERGGPQPGQPGLFEGLQQREPVGRDGGAEDARRARDHRGHPHGRECPAHRARLLVGAHEHGDVAGLDRHPVDRRRAAEQARHVGRQIGDDQIAGGRDERHVPPRRGGQAPPGRDPDAHRRTERRACQASTGPRRGDRVHDDPLVAERGPVEHLLQRGEQRLVAAVVDGERGVPLGRARGLQVA